MRPDPTTISRLLALPIEVRRRLAEQPGPGWLIFAFEGRISIELRTRPPAHMDPECESWYPASEVAWMTAATPPGGGWEAWSAVGSAPARWVIIRGPDGSPDDYGDEIASAPTPEECALAALEANNKPG